MAKYATSYHGVTDNRKDPPQNYLVNKHAVDGGNMLEIADNKA